MAPIYLGIDFIYISRKIWMCSGLYFWGCDKMGQIRTPTETLLTCSECWDVLTFWNHLECVSTWLLETHFNCMTLQKQHVEGLLWEGCHQLSLKAQSGRKVNIKEMAAYLNIPYITLRAHFLNVHKPCSEAHTDQQFLSPTQEQLLIE